MTAEQLEELRLLKARLGEDVFYGEERLHKFKKHNPLHLDAINTLDNLARRVIVAEKLVEALDKVLQYAQGTDPWHGFKDARAALTAYRESSK